MALENASMVVGNHTGVLGLRWFDLAWVSHVCVFLCVQRPEVASVYAFHGWNTMAGKHCRDFKKRGTVVAHRGLSKWENMTHVARYRDLGGACSWSHR